MAVLSGGQTSLRASAGHGREVAEGRSPPPIHPPLPLACRGPVACLATTSSATTKATAGAPSPRPSPPSARCTSTRQGTAKVTPNLHPTRNWWTPPSPPAATHPLAPTPTSTTPTTPPWPAPRAPPAPPARPAPRRATGPPRLLLSGCRRQRGSSTPRGKQEGGASGALRTGLAGRGIWWQEALCCSTCIVPQRRSLPGSLDRASHLLPGSFLPTLCPLVL